jgi:DNA-binding response OmpR family regulator
MKQPSRKIIIIDDNVSMASLLTTLLEMDNFEVSAINQFTESSIFETLKSKTPDAVIIDIHLRGVNGLEILRRMKTDPALKEIKAIVSSGENLYDEAIKSGADYFLLKPYMPSELLGSLKNLTGQNGGKIG